MGGFYSELEMQQLLDCIHGDECELCIQLAAFYGLRRSEVIVLQWDAIDFDNKTILIKNKVTEAMDAEGHYELIVEEKQKNQSSRRLLPMIPYIEPLLRAEQRKQAYYRELCGKSYDTAFDGYVCRKATGELIRPNYMSEHFDWLLQKYHLRKIRLHDLRHTCASLMLKNGVQMKQIQEWLGHSSFATTANCYSHLDYASKLNSIWLAIWS